MIESVLIMSNVVTIKLCRVCEKSHANPLRAPVHLINLNGKLMLVDIWGDVVCPSCRIRWKREPASHSW